MTAMKYWKLHLQRNERMIFIELRVENKMDYDTHSNFLWIEDNERIEMIRLINICQ